MAEIKSALEMALQRAEQFGRATKEEMAEAQYREQGRLWAVKYLKEEAEDLEEELKKLPDPAQAAARSAAKEVFLRNIALPRNGEADPRQERALQGLLLMAANKKTMAQLQAEVVQLMSNFLQVRNSAYQQLKARFAGSIGNMQRAMEAQTGQRVRLEVENLPQFQEEWRRFRGQLYDQFEPMLEDLKAQMAHF